jgi:signal transduction histidine kinase
VITQADQLESTAEAKALPRVSVASAPAPGSADARLDELAEIIRAYNLATDNLQRSHEALRQQVVRLQEQLASADAQLQRSKRLAALGEMAAGIAHEIRNPLGAIQLYAGMLVEDLGSLPSVGRAQSTPIITNCVETADKIRSAVRGLDGIVNDVLSFARELAPHRICVSVQALFDRALDSQRPAIEAAGVRVQQLCVPPDLAVFADSDLLRQALLNLIRNAVQAISEPPTRNRPATITLAARREDGLVALIVRDNGPGIAPEHIERIFNPFFTTRSTGTGLGLAIVHRIVDAHGGTISVHNDHGAVFELRLPEKQEFFTTEARRHGERQELSDKHP